MARCWDKDPDRRPYFPEICERLSEIMLEAAIRDRVGFQFWKSVALKKVRLTFPLGFIEKGEEMERKRESGRSGKENGERERERERERPRERERESLSLTSV